MNLSFIYGQIMEGLGYFAYHNHWQSWTVEAG